jgi:hypothetical protein
MLFRCIYLHVHRLLQILYQSCLVPSVTLSFVYPTRPRLIASEGGREVFPQLRRWGFGPLKSSPRTMLIVFVEGFQISNPVLQGTQFLVRPWFDVVPDGPWPMFPAVGHPNLVAVLAGAGGGTCLLFSIGRIKLSSADDALTHH